MKFRYFYVLILGFFYTFPAAAAGSQTPIKVVAEPVELKAFYERIEALGTLLANESVDITANVADTITAIHFTDNQRVEADQVLVEMTDTEEQALLEEAIATKNEATKQFERVRTLSKQGNAAKSLLDQRKREMETAKARLLAIQSRLKDRLIIAPFAGVVGLRNISVGAFVEPGDPITTLDDDSQMRLDFSVPAIFLGAVKVGQPIEASTPAYGSNMFKGEIISLDSRIDPVTRSFVARAMLPNPDFVLKPGLLMEVNITSNPREVLVIPEGALVPDADKQFVYVVNEDEQGATLAQKTEVQIGGRRPGEVEILAGLKEGQSIVIDGTIKLRDGMAIEPSATAY